MSYEASVHAKAIELVKLAIRMTEAAGSGHPTSAASLAHIVTVLMYDHMRYDPAEPDHPAADRLVLSEGHACPIVYAAAADIGIVIGRDSAERRRMTREDAMRLREIDSEIDGHPNPAEGFPFFPAATGSLGQGLSVAAGLALAARVDGIDRRVFCLIGDGESREGQIQEALDFIADHRVTAVCPIFNANAYGQTGKVSPQQAPEALLAKLEASGFDVRRIDGHRPADIRAALDEHVRHAADSNGRPFAIVADTIKGWGSATAQRGNRHGKPLDGAEAEQALAELDRTGAELGASFAAGDLKRSRPASRTTSAPARRAVPSLRQTLERFDQQGILGKGALAPRKAYGWALRALGHADSRVVALDADVGNSTFSEYFYSDPELRPRFFECRIAEQNMVSVAAGLASGGKIPFVSTFGKFLVRAFDQIEMAIVGRAAIKLCGSHVGVSLAADGPSQMALPDVAFFRSFATVEDRQRGPTMYVLQPADAWAAYALTLAMAEHHGACYMRTVRPDVRFLYGEGDTFSLGGHRVVVRGEGLLVAAAGYMVHEVMAALDGMAARGLRPTVVDLYSIPFDGRAIAGLASEHGGRVLTVEDNYGAGLGSAVADALTAQGGDFRVRQLHVRRIPKSGREPEDVLAWLGLAAGDIAEAALALGRP